MSIMQSLKIDVRREKERKDSSLQSSHLNLFASRSAFSLIEMMIAIVILGLGLVMTATMFPVAWTRARTLTEYTTQRVVSQSAATTLTDTLQASGSVFTPYNDKDGNATGKFLLASGSIAGDLFYDPMLDSVLDCNPPSLCFKHWSVLLTSDTRVHALHMENFVAGTSVVVPEKPFRIERMPEICDTDQSPAKCRDDFQPVSGSGYWPFCAESSQLTNGVIDGAQFCARSFYSPQVSLGTRMYPPLEAPPADTTTIAFAAWLEKFGGHRYAWAALHRLRSIVGPPVSPPVQLSVADSKLIASQAAAAVGTTRVFDFYIVTLKRPQSTSRYALQVSNDPAALPSLTDRSIAFKPLAQIESTDVSLPVAWRVQVEFPALVFGVPSTGIPTEVQVPATKSIASPAENLMIAGMFPVGTRFVDEITGRVYHVSRRRTNTNEVAFLALDREVLPQDLDESDADQLPVPNAQVDPHETLRTVWVYPPPIAERPTPTTVVFDDKSPVVGIDVRTISMTPPG